MNHMEHGKHFAEVSGTERACDSRPGGAPSAAHFSKAGIVAGGTHAGGEGTRSSSGARAHSTRQLEQAVSYEHGNSAQLPARAASRGRGRSTRRASVLVALVITVLLVAAGGTYAWYSQQTSAVNTFQKAELAPTVEESFTEGKTKSDVKVTANTASVDVYVRAQVTFSWTATTATETDGSASAVFGAPVENTDYKITWGSTVYSSPTSSSPTSDQLAAGCWLKGNDGYYYWSVPLSAGKSTENLIDECVWLTSTTAASGTSLVCDVSAQAIQSGTSTSPFGDAWTGSGFSIDTDGVLKVGSSS